MVESKLCRGRRQVMFFDEAMAIADKEFVVIT
jgi:hypothetical protein